MLEHILVLRKKAEICYYDLKYYGVKYYDLTFKWFRSKMNKYIKWCVCMCLERQIENFLEGLNVFILKNWEKTDFQAHSSLKESDAIEG